MSNSEIQFQRLHKFITSFLFFRYKIVKYCDMHENGHETRTFYHIFTIILFKTHSQRIYLMMFDKFKWLKYYRTTDNVNLSLDIYILT